MLSLEFFINVILPVALWPCGRLASTGSENQGKITCQIKVAGVYGCQTYHLHVPIVLKSGSLYLLDPSGSFEVCTGVALPYRISYIHSHNFLFYPTRSRTVNCKCFMLRSYSLISVPMRHTKVICSLLWEGWGGAGLPDLCSLCHTFPRGTNFGQPHMIRSGEFRLNWLNYYFCSFIDTLSTSHHGPRIVDWRTMNCKRFKGNKLWRKRVKSCLLPARSEN